MMLSDLTLTISDPETNNLLYILCKYCIFFKVGLNLVALA